MDINHWDKFWAWMDGSYIYQTLVVGFILGYILFGLLKVTKFHIGKDGVDIERFNKDGVGAVLSERFKKLEDRICEIESVLKLHDRLVIKAATKAGIGVAWSDKGAPFEETILAILDNLLLHENGNHETRLVEVIMGRGKDKGIEDFNRILNKFIKENKDYLDSYFHEVIARIRVEIH